MGAGVRLRNPCRRNSEVLAGCCLDEESAWLSAQKAHVAGDKLARDQAVLAERLRTFRVAVRQAARTRSLRRACLQSRAAWTGRSAASSVPPMAASPLLDRLKLMGAAWILIRRRLPVAYGIAWLACVRQGERYLTDACATSAQIGIRRSLGSAPGIGGSDRDIVVETRGWMSGTSGAKRNSWMMNGSRSQGHSPRYVACPAPGGSSTAMPGR